MKQDDDERLRKTYIIPLNFALEGKAFGNVSWENLIQAVVIFLALFVLVILFVPTVTYKICGAIVCAAPAVVAVNGINGLSVGSFLMDMLHFRATAQVYGKPTAEAVLAREKQIIKAKHKKLKQDKKQAKKNAKLVPGHGTAIPRRDDDAFLAKTAGKSKYGKKTKKTGGGGGLF